MRSLRSNSPNTVVSGAVAFISSSVHEVTGKETSSPSIVQYNCTSSITVPKFSPVIVTSALPTTLAGDISVISGSGITVKS